MLNYDARLVLYPLSNTPMLLLLRGVRWMPRYERMIVDMMDANHISERLACMRNEMNDLKVINARYWVKSPHTALDKSAHALREGRLLGIKQELADMMKRLA